MRTIFGLRFLLFEACGMILQFFFFSSRRRHTRFDCDWSSDVCSSDLASRADPAFRAQAYGLLGAAYDNVGHPKEAAEAYQQAADAAQLPFLKAQFLTEAGRAWVAAGDTARAVQAYRAVVAQTDSSAMMVSGEAKVRLGELTKGIQ